MDPAIRRESKPFQQGSSDLSPPHVWLFPSYVGCSSGSRKGVQGAQVAQVAQPATTTTPRPLAHDPPGCALEDTKNS